MDEGDLCEADGDDLCEVDHNKLITAHTRMPQLPPHFSEASHAANMLFFLPSSLLKVKKLQPSPSKLVVCPEADGSGFCVEHGG